MCHSCLIVRSVACLGCSKSSALPPTFEADYAQGTCQWGGSTLVQMYMAWIQCTQCRNWHSLICAHVKDTAASIRACTPRCLPAIRRTIGPKSRLPQFRPYERSINTRVISGRDCRVTVGSSEDRRPCAVPTTRWLISARWLSGPIPPCVRPRGSSVPCAEA